MTKEEAFEVWVASTRYTCLKLCTDTSIDRKNGFEEWWKEQEKNTDKVVQLTGDGIPYEYYMVLDNDPNLNTIPRSIECFPKNSK